jgi:hypothetical protein|tara:strand:+ start:332 stop:541 length:210 start_codon:yes stop_codon:yes gene_type:complete
MTDKQVTAVRLLNTVWFSGTTRGFSGKQDDIHRMKGWISIEIAFIVPIPGWFVLLQLYGPLEPWFERRW